MKPGMGKKSIILFGAGALIVLVFGVASWNQARVERVQPEKMAAQKLTGDYYLGDGLGMNCLLTLSPDGTFEFCWTGCLGVYGENKGRYHVEKGVLVLSPEYGNVQKDTRGTPPRFLPVAWGRREYMIPEDEVGEFCEQINRGMEPRNGAQGDFYLRRGDEKKPVTSLPDLPEKWRRFLTKRS